jgi:hypothetical protein
VSENANNKKENKPTPSKDKVVVPVEEIEESIEVDEVLEPVQEEAPIAEEVAVEEEKPVVIEATKAAEKPGLGFVGNGAMGVATFKEEKKPAPIKKDVKKEETVAIYSSRNVTWAEVGKVYIGYNIVSKEASEKWLTRDHTRLATPEEVAQEFGN